MEPVKGGTLANIPEEAENLFKSYHPNMSIASWAMIYTASLDGVLTVLSGMSNLEQLKYNISYMDNFKPLNKEEYKSIEKTIKIINESIAIPCTQCNYCLESCTANISISKYFELYNIEKRLPSKGFSAQQAYYRT